MKCFAYNSPSIQSLSLRSKEIAMQNARLAELEKVLAKTSVQPTPRIKSSGMTSSEEMNSLKQEIRVVSISTVVHDKGYFIQLIHSLLAM
jgi:hypothetical protein